MASWAVTCTNCNSNIVHSQIVLKNLSDLFFPAKPDVSAGTTMTCPECGTVVSYVRTDLRYLSAQPEIGPFSDHARSKTVSKTERFCFLFVSLFWDEKQGFNRKTIILRRLSNLRSCGW